MVFTSLSLSTFACFLSVLPILEREEPEVWLFSSALFVANIFILLGKDPDLLVATFAPSFFDFERSSSSNFSVDSIIFCTVWMIISNVVRSALFCDQHKRINCVNLSSAGKRGEISDGISGRSFNSITACKTCQCDHSAQGNRKVRISHSTIPKE